MPKKVKSNSTSLRAKIKLREGRYVVIYHRNKMWRTGVTIVSPDEFSKGQLTSRYRGKEDYRELNNIIISKLNLINNLITEALRKGVDSLDYLNAYFKEQEKKLKQIAITNKTELPVAFEEYLKVKKFKLKDFREDKSYERYLSELSRLRDYHKENYTVLSDLTDDEWFYKFVKWLVLPYTKTFEVYNSRTEISYKCTKSFQQTNSTVARFLQDLITFMKFVQLNTKINFPIQEVADFMNDLITPEDDKETVVALTKAQWRAFKEYQPREKFEYEVRTYDLYRFCVNTGLRYCDTIKLNDMFVNRDNEITMLASKTRGRFTVPMNEDALRIYEKYGRDFRGKFPKNQQINKNLKKLLQQIPEFLENSTIYKFVLNKVEIEQGKTWQVMKFHSSRRSFVSFAINNGAGIPQVQKFTGWKDSRTLNNYLKIFGEKENNDRIILNF